MIYWANIGRVVFAASNDTLMNLTGATNPQNLGIDISCRDFYAKGKKDIKAHPTVAWPVWEVSLI